MSDGTAFGESLYHLRRIERVMSPEQVSELRDHEEWYAQRFNRQSERLKMSEDREAIKGCFGKGLLDLTVLLPWYLFSFYALRRRRGSR